MCVCVWGGGIHVGSIFIELSKYIILKINHQKGVHAIGILQLYQVFYNATFSKIWIMLDDWKIAKLKTDIGCYFGSLHFI
jgi:hypothetical protein